MATKQEIEDELNEQLGLDIEWSELKKDDLEKIQEGVHDEEFIKRFVAVYANDVAGNMAQDQVQSWQPGQFVTLAAQMQEGKANPMDFFM